MTADYCQIEMRIMAHLSDDAGLIEAFTPGEDLHTFVASRGLRRARWRGRPGAAPAGQGDVLRPGLRAVGVRARPAAAASRRTRPRSRWTAYFARFGGVRDYLRDVVDQARKDGYTATILDRRRYLPDLTSDNAPAPADGRADGAQRPDPGLRRRHHQDRDAGRRPRAARRRALRSRLLLQVHDELVLEVAAGERDALEELVRGEMGAAYPLSVPLDVSVGVGRTWDDAGH